jgi:hypothetical protein
VAESGQGLVMAGRELVERGIIIDVPKSITETAAQKHEHEYVNMTTRWDNYPLQR